MFFRYCIFLFNGNVLITRIKENTVYKSIEELDLPEDINQDILKNELIYLTSPKARGKGINRIKCRLISIFKADENKACRSSVIIQNGKHEPLLTFIKNDRPLNCFLKR